jgi:hypothetical protein
MNALDLLHKIRTCDKQGRFAYSDTEVLNDLIMLIQEAEAGAREIAIEQAQRGQFNTVRRFGPNGELLWTDREETRSPT